MTMRGIYVSEAQVQAEAMALVVERGRPGSLERLRLDPLADLMQWDELSVTACRRIVHRGNGRVASQTCCPHAMR